MADDFSLKKTIPRDKGLNVIYKGIFEFKNLYAFMYEWLRDEGFVDDNGMNGEMWETFYWERRSPQGFTDYNIWWRLKMNPLGQASAWYQYKFGVNFIGLGIQKTEVMHNGKKVGAYNGEIGVTIVPKIEVDYQNFSASGSFLGRLINADMFKNRILKKDFKYHKDQIDDIAFRFQEAIKDFFGLTTFTDKGIPFHSNKGGIDVKL